MYRHAQQINKPKLHLIVCISWSTKTHNFSHYRQSNQNIYSITCPVDYTGPFLTHYPMSTPSGFFLLTIRELNSLPMRFTKGNLWPPHFFNFDEELEEIDTFFLKCMHVHTHEIARIYLFMLFDVAIDRRQRSITAARCWPLEWPSSIL